MAAKPLFLLSLNLAGAWAQSGSSCLDPKNAGAANKADCCAGSGTGESDVGGVVFEFTCNSYANNYGAHSHPAKNAHACAQLCLKDTTCHASSWEPSSGGTGGNCWLSSAGFTLTPDPYKTWVILVNTERAGHVINPKPDPPATNDCDEEVKKAEESCNSEKEELANQHQQECTAEKDAMEKQHDQDCQNKIKDEVDTCQSTAEAKCENDKTLLKQAEQAQCAKDKADSIKNIQSQLDTCNSKLNALNKPAPPPNQSSGSGANPITRNGKRWQIYRNNMYARTFNYGLNTLGWFSGANLDSCIDRCSQISGCSVAWVHYAQNACQLGRKTEGQLQGLAGSDTAVLV